MGWTTTSAQQTRGALITPQMQISLQDDRDRAVVARGKLERSCLQEGTALEPTEQRGAINPDAGAGFGGGGGGAAAASASKKKAGGKKKAAGKKAPAKKTKSGLPSFKSAMAAEMKKNGVVRIDGALSPETVEKLREFVDAERVRCTEGVAKGHVAKEERFANLVLLDKRCDLLMPLHGPVLDALDELLGEGSVVGPLLEITGADGYLQELACLISEPGSEQQPLHRTRRHGDALRIHRLHRAARRHHRHGTTVYLPGTQTEECHKTFFGGDLAIAHDPRGVRRPPVPEEFLKSRPVKLGLLKAGDCALYNQQTLHCGSANQSDRTRRQFYISVRNPNVDAKTQASIRPSFLKGLPLADMRAELKALKAGGGGLFAKLDERDAAVVRQRASPATPAQ